MLIIRIYISPLFDGAVKEFDDRYAEIEAA